MEKHEETSQHTPIERVQVGVRMEKRMIKVLKGLAEYHDLTLGDLLEGIVLHAFESLPPFSEESLRKIAQLKEVYGMNYGAEASHRLTETPTGEERHTESLRKVAKLKEVYGTNLGAEVSHRLTETPTGEERK